MADRWTRALSLALLLGLAACRSSERNDSHEEGASSARAPERLQVAVGRCEGLFEVEPRPRCVRAPDAPRPVLWIADVGPDDTLQVRLGGVPLTEGYELRRHPDGVVVELASNIRGIVELTANSGRFELELTASSNNYRAAKTRAVDALQRSRADADAVLREAKLEPAEQFLLDCQLVRRTRDVAALERIRAAAAAVGELVCINLVLGIATHEAITSSNFTAAAAHIAEVRQRALHLEGRLQAGYYDGVLAGQLGLLDDALAAHARTVELAERVGNTHYQGAGLVEQASMLARLGRFAEAGRLARAAKTVVQDSFAVEIRLTSAWVDIVRRQHDPSVEDPADELRALLAAFEQSDRRRREIVRLNLAVALVQSGAHAEASAQLEALDLSQLDARQRLYYELTWCRLELASGEIEDASERLERAELFADIARDREFMLEILEERANLEIERGRPDQALAAYRRADELADRLALEIPADAGRTAFSTKLTRARARYVELLVELGHLDEALCTILAARARHSRALAARPDRLRPDRLRPDRLRQDRRYVELLGRYHEHKSALAARLTTKPSLTMTQLRELERQEAEANRELDAMLAEVMELLEYDPPPWRCEDVRPRSPSQALLTMYPSSTRRGFWFAAARADRVELFELEGDAAAVASLAVDELKRRGLLDEVDDLLVVPVGSLTAVELHALPQLHDINVRYGVGVGATEAANIDARPKSAVVVAASHGNLSEVEAEADEVAASLRARGWRVDPSWTPTAGEPPTLLHYAGHATHGDATGWESALLLSESQKLTSRQLLVEQRAPAHVVLGACEAGATDVHAIDGGMNIAFAFLLAGAEMVIATDRAIEDPVARAFAAALYPELPADRAPTVSQWVAAVASVQRRDPAFSSFRVWVR